MAPRAPVRLFVVLGLGLGLTGLAGVGGFVILGSLGLSFLVLALGKLNFVYVDILFSCEATTTKQ